MWYSGQTLRNVDTNKLARLCPEKDSTFAWNIGKGTAFIDENGKKFFDDSSKYTHISDEFGRAVSGQIKKGQFVDVSLKRYLVSKKKLLDMKNLKCQEWEIKILKELDNKKYCHCPFADGSFCNEFQEWFLKKYGAISSYKAYDDFKKKHSTDMCRQYLFKYNDKIWIYNEMLHEISLLNKNYMKFVINKLGMWLK